MVHRQKQQRSRRQCRVRYEGAASATTIVTTAVPVRTDYFQEYSLGGCTIDGTREGTTYIQYFCNPSNTDGRVHVYVCIWLGLGLGLVLGFGLGLGFAMICSGHGHLC